MTVPEYEMHIAGLEIQLRTAKARIEELMDTVGYWRTRGSELRQHIKNMGGDPNEVS